MKEQKRRSIYRSSTLSNLQIHGPVTFSQKRLLHTRSSLEGRSKAVAFTGSFAEYDRSSLRLRMMISFAFNVMFAISDDSVMLKVVDVILQSLSSMSLCMLCITIMRLGKDCQSCVPCSLLPAPCSFLPASAPCSLLCSLFPPSSLPIIDRIEGSFVSKHSCPA